MSKVLIETAMFEGPKFVDAPELACILHLKALLYSANALTDGFIPESKTRSLVKADSRTLKQAVDHLTTVQPGCSSASWETRPGGWYLHDYDDPQYANPLRVDRTETARQRQLSGRTGGLASAKSRREKYGSAQPTRTEDAGSPSSAPEANPEAPSRRPPEANASTVDKSPPKQTSNPNPKLPSLPLPTSPDPSLPSSSPASIQATSGVRAALKDAIQNGHTDDLALQLAVRAGELLGRTLAPLEVSMCSIFLDDFAYLSVDDMLQRMHDHLEHCKANDLPTPRKLHGFRETLRLENEHQADARAPKAWRADPIAVGALIASERDPDE